MKNEHLIFIGIFWVLPIMGGLWFSVRVWQFFKRFDYRIAAIFRALAIAVIFTPAYVHDEGFLPFQSSIFLFFSVLNGSFLDNALVAIPPISLVWLFLILIRDCPLGI